MYLPHTVYEYKRHFRWNIAKFSHSVHLTRPLREFASEFCNGGAQKDQNEPAIADGWHVCIRSDAFPVHFQQYVQTDGQTDANGTTITCSACCRTYNNNNNNYYYFYNSPWKMHTLDMCVYQSYTNRRTPINCITFTNQFLAAKLNT